MLLSTEEALTLGWALVIEEVEYRIKETEDQSKKKVAVGRVGMTWLSEWHQKGLFFSLQGREEIFQEGTKH